MKEKSEGFKGSAFKFRGNLIRPEFVRKRVEELFQAPGDLRYIFSPILFNARRRGARVCCDAPEAVSRTAPRSALNDSRGLGLLGLLFLEKLNRGGL